MAAQTTLLLISVAAYLALAKLALALRDAKWRVRLFAAINILGLGWLVIAFDCLPLLARSTASFPSLAENISADLAIFALYVLLVLLNYCVLAIFAERQDWTPWLAALSPVAMLVAFKYVVYPTHTGPFATHVYAIFIGISYLVFRLSHMALRVRSKVVPKPTLAEYLGFAFFLPVMVVGPITQYRSYRNSLLDPQRSRTPLKTSLLRIVVGAVKFAFLANVVSRLSYSSLLLDGHAHTLIDLIIAATAYYLYLYCNFSGFCDMAIGAAGLLGIYVQENFNNPFAARSIKDFWNRWHITLSVYLRDIVFTPLSMLLAQRLGEQSMNAVIAICIAVVFLLVGVWHGIQWHYLAFGAAHSLGMVTHYYYTLWMKQKLGSARYRAYDQHRWVNAAALVLTFVFVSATYILFANDETALRQIVYSLRAGWAL